MDFMIIYIYFGGTALLLLGYMILSTCFILGSLSIRNAWISLLLTLCVILATGKMMESQEISKPTTDTTLKTAGPR